MKNTSLCYIEQEGCYLLLHRVKKVNDVNKDKWVGIGGRLEENESPEECVLREVWEETGLHLTRWRYCGIVTFVSDLWEGEYMHLFHADGFDGTLREDCDEGVLEWVPFVQFDRLPQMKNGVKVVEIIEGQILMEGSMKLKCLAPMIRKNSKSEDIYEGESNSASMVIQMEYGEFDMLLTGDVEEKGEELLTEVLENNYTNVSWDVLKVAHHGSKNSSTEDFLNIVTPAYAIISAGRENFYGHPHEETLQRLAKVGSIVLSTQECGAITITTDGKNMKVERYLDGNK